MTYKEKVKELVSEQSFVNLVKYVELIEEKNKVMNLTGFKDDILWRDGIYESIVLLTKGFGKAFEQKILDIGAGAGFPSVPYLIAFPSNRLTIYEPQGKRMVFLKEVREELELDIEIINIRAEDSEDVEKFDLITARAVADLKILMEVSHKVGKMNARYVFIKGPNAENEIQTAQRIMKKLSITDIFNDTLVIGDKENHLVTYIKEKTTPKWCPRTWQEILRDK